MKRFQLTVILFVLLSPIYSFAATCTSSGFTVIYVNGIFTTEQQAKEEAKKLGGILDPIFKSEPLTVQAGYNETHLGGGGDLLQSLAQAFNGSVSDYDLDTILMQIAPEVTMKKILLVGHSQGAFYTDEMYGYLTTHGVPKESIAVYNIATPGSFVAGGGGYVTSTNDKVMNAVRDAEVAGNVQAYLNSYYVIKGVVASALRANITVPKEPGWEGNPLGGHYFSVYLDGAGERIVSDIERELSRLKATSGDTAGACFKPPQPTLAHAAQTALFSVADPVVSGARDSLGAVSNGAMALAQDMYGAFATMFGAPKGGQVAAAALPLSTAQLQLGPAQEEETASPDVVPESEVATAVEPVLETPPAPPPPPPEEPAAQPPPAAVVPMALQISPGFGGGGGAASVQAPIVQEEQPAAATSSPEQESQPEPIKEAAPTPPDTTPPEAPSIAVAACEASLVAGPCVVPTTTVEVSWPAAANAVSYAFVTNGVVGATTSATSAAATLSSGATTTLAVVAYDEAGNAATSSTLDVAALLQPLVINEIGWGGSGTSATGGGIIHHDYQWIELKNRSPYKLDLSHITIGRSTGMPIALSGTLSPALLQQYLVVEPTAVSFTGGNTLVVPFSALSTTTAEQLSLVWTPGSGTPTTLDATPAPDACPTWCAGSFLQVIGTSAGIASGVTSPISMERKDGALDGTLSSSWQPTDGYASWIPGTSGGYWGTPGAPNSGGLPESGVYCDSPKNLLTSDIAFNPTGECEILSMFIAGDTYGAQREGGLYEGDVASSTPLGGGFGPSKAPVADVYITVPADTPAGTRFFFAVWEQRSFADLDSFQFNTYFTQGTGAPPHGNYVTLPFTYAP